MTFYSIYLFRKSIYNRNVIDLFINMILLKITFKGGDKYVRKIY